MHVDFLLERRENVLVVPRAALIDDGARSYVVADQNGRWVERTVRTGLRTAQRVEVSSGLEEGTTIVADKQAWKARSEKR